MKLKKHDNLLSDWWNSQWVLFEDCFWSILPHPVSGLISQFVNSKTQNAQRQWHQLILKTVQIMIIVMMRNVLLCKNTSICWQQQPVMNIFFKSELTDTVWIIRLNLGQVWSALDYSPGGISRSSIAACSSPFWQTTTDFTVNVSNSETLLSVRCVSRVFTVSATNLILPTSEKTPVDNLLSSFFPFNYIS